ncbi:hypothetical protein K2F43_05995 [Clostridium estertheticum]|uniref:hypothetical protein n=1 Tax=Clostridium estertheticum TaxID=238834 RepID=UPI001C6DFF4F|nr:hypothetical protein [Clostridium estertheticum]MBW9170757.1 hypothetical protein [Clostridium estertheticum]WLC74403.1 hypothetical protein KTC99_16755 [Clostridium estertheticum]
MITDNLKVGMIFKNYKDLCNYLNEQEKGRGNSRNSQFEDWKRFFIWHKVGNKLVIDEIFDIPLDKIDGRKDNGHAEGSRNNNNPYGQYVDLILREYMSSKKESIFYVTTNILAKEFGLINSNYSCASSNKSKFLKYSYKDLNTDVNKQAMYDGFSAVKDALKGVVRSSLNRLASTGAISCKETYVIIFNNNTRIPSEMESIAIKDCEDEILLEINTTRKLLQLNDKLKNEYYNKVNKLIKEKMDYFTEYFVGYKIQKLNTIVSELSNEEIIEQKQNTNNFFKTRIGKSFNKKRNKTIAEEGKYLGLVKGHWKRWDIDRVSSNYMHYAEYFIASLIGLKYKFIVKEIEQIKFNKYTPFGEDVIFEGLSQAEIKELAGRADEETRDVIEMCYLSDNLKSVP